MLAVLAELQTAYSASSIYVIGRRRFYGEFGGRPWPHFNAQAHIGRCLDLGHTAI